MNQETINVLQLCLAVFAAFGTFLGGIYIVVTRPILRLIESEGKLTRTELRAEMKDMETRLNNRIDTKLVHH